MSDRPPRDYTIVIILYAGFMAFMVLWINWRAATECEKNLSKAPTISDTVRVLSTRICR